MRGRLLVLAALLGGALLLGGGYLILLGRSPTAPASAPPRDGALTLIVSDPSGLVEVADPPPAGSAPSAGRFRPARPGEPLSPSMRVRTGDDGAVTLRAADGSTVRLSSATSARVESLSRELARLSFAGGGERGWSVEADVVDDPRRLVQIDLDDPEAVSAGPGATARSHGARFVATRDGEGHGTVAAQRGEVVLSARGKEVTIHTGQYARVAPGAAPDLPSQIPPSLFLKVVWPAARTRERKLVVEGEATAGARVIVAGRPARVDATGHYRKELELPDGEHRLDVEATDVVGRTSRERSPPILIDRTTDFRANRPRWGR